MITTSQSKSKKERSDACSLVALGFCRIDLDTIRIISVAVRHDFKAQKFQVIFGPKIQQGKYYHKNFHYLNFLLTANSLLRRIL